MAKQLKLYLGCGLTDSPPEFRSSIEDLRKVLKAVWNPQTGSRQYEVFDFLGLTAGTPTLVYEKDIEENVSTCDLFLGVCDYPSIGLGYELAVAVEKRGIPTLAVAREGRRVTRLVQGIKHPHYTFATYQDLLNDVPRLLEEKIEAEMWDFGVGHPVVARGHAIGLDDEMK